MSKTAIESPQCGNFSYADLERESGRFAQFFSELGLSKGDRIAVQVDKSPRALFLYLGSLRAGLIFVPLNTAYTRQELDYLIGNATPKVMVGQHEKLPLLEEIGQQHQLPHIIGIDANGNCSEDERILSADPVSGAVDCSDDDVAVILYTSGTTGQPKGAMITHGNLKANGLALQKAWGWQADDVLLHALPIFHIHGLFVACHCALLGGSKMIFLPGFSVDEVKRQLSRSTVFMGVPTMYTRLLADPEFNADLCAGMRLFTCGSAPLLEHTFEQFRQRSGHTILERYGMTETGMNTSNPLDGQRIAGTVGKPLPGVTVRVVDESGRPVADGDIGQLQVKGNNVFKGYWNMPERTAEEFTADGYFKTGDLSRIDENGYVAIVGRAKDMVISGGFNVYPKEIEKLIDEIPGIMESAVIGLPHPDFGEAVTAVVVAKKNTELPDENQIIGQLKTVLAGYKVPKRIFFLTALPRNTMGKVQKNILQDQFGATFTGDQ